jgi:hypothetical protein
MNTRQSPSDHVQLLTIDDVAERLCVTPDMVRIVHQFEDQELYASQVQILEITPNDQSSKQA